MPETVQNKISAARSRWRGVRALAGAGYATASVCLLCLVSFYADRLLVLGYSGRLAAAVILVLALAASVAWWVAAPALRRIPDAEIATLVERRYPVLQERLLTSIELARAGAAAGASGTLVAQLQRETEAAALPLRFGAAVPLRPLGRPWALGALFLFLFVAHWLVAPQYMKVWLSRMLHPGADIPIFARTHVWVLPGDRVIPRGEGVQVGVQIGGRMAEGVRLFMRSDGARWNEMSLNRYTPGGAPGTRLFTLRLPAVQQSFEYYARANDGRSNPHTVRVEDRPAVVGMRLRYLFPAYTHLPARTEAASSGSVAAPLGTRVELLGTANKPLAAAVYVHDGKPAGPWRVDGATFRGAIDVARNFTYGFRLKDRNDFDNLVPPQYTVRAQPDLAPLAAVTAPGADIERTPRGSVKLAVKATDDYGVASVSIAYAVRDRKGALGLSGGGGTAVQASGVWQLASLRLKAGDTLTYQAVARDNCTVEAAHTGRSAAYHIRIVGEREMQDRLDNDAAQQEESLRDLARRQKEARALVAAAQRDAAKTESAQQAERSLAQETAALAQRMSQTNQQLQDNGLGTRSELQRRQQTEQMLQSMARNSMPAAANTIQRAQAQQAERTAALADAARQEQAIQAALERASRELGRAADAAELAAQADKLADEQQKLAEEASLQGARTQGVPPARLSAAEKAAAAQLAQRQTDLRARTQGLQTEIERSARDAREKGDTAAEPLERASAGLRQANVGQEQRAAEKNLQDAKPEAAARQANEAARDLRQAARNLDPTNQANGQSLQQRANQMQDAARKLNGLADQQEQLARRTGENPNAETSRDLAQQQQALRSAAQQAAAQLPGATEARADAARATRQMGQSAQELQNARPKEANAPATDAARSLRQAAQNAQQMAEALDRERRATAAQHAVEQMAAEQRAIKADTAQAAAQAQKGQLNADALQKRANEIGQRQGKLADRGEQVKQNARSDAFNWAVGRAQQLMWDARRGLDSKRLGQDTQAAQEHAAQTLERISRSLEQQAQAAHQQAMNSAQQTEADDKLAESVSDLQLTREMEAQLHEETTALDQQRQSNPGQQLSYEQQGQADRLRDLQDQNQRRADQLAEKLRSRPDLVGSVRSAASQMNDVRDDLGKHQTGQDTQGREKRVVETLDQSLNAARQAMRQRQQQMMAQMQAQQEQQGQMSQPRSRATQPAPRDTSPITQVQAGVFGQPKRGGRGFGALSPRAQQSMREGQGERVPAEYQELVKQYYRALSDRER